MKKKLLILIATLMLILSFKYDVKADSSPPASGKYEVVVTNEKGTPLYSENGEIVTTIPYKGVATVVYESFDDNDKKMYVTYKEYDAFWSYYVKAEDVIPKEYDFSKAVKLEKKAEEIVLNKNGGVLYEGPSKVFNKLSKVIPVGTIITYEYMADESPWAYVEYDGVKGWLWVYEGKEGTLGYIVSKTNPNVELLTITNNAKLYSSIYTEENEVIGKIAVGDKLNCKYDYYSGVCYVEYKGQNGWVKYDGNFVYKSTSKDKDSYYYNSKVFTVYDTDVYKDIEFKSKYNLEIPANTLLNDFYYQYYHDEPGFYGAFYVKYQNQYGWVPENMAIVYNENDDISSTIFKDLNVYEKPDSNSKIITVIPEGTSIRSNCDYITELNEYENTCWSYVTYNGVKGWVSEVERDANNDENIDGGENDDNNNDEVDDEEETNWFNSLTPLQFSLLCIGGACILAATSIVIIALIKKNNDKKTKDNKKEIVKNTETTETKNEQVAKVEETLNLEKQEKTTEEQIPIKK